MGIWRKWIFPSLRILIFAVIAVALVKIAFFATDEVAGGEILPQGMIEETTVTPAIASISNEILLDATVVNDDATPARATGGGDVTVLFVKNGARVETGAPIVELRQEVSPAETSVDEEGRTTTTRAVYRYTNVTAPRSGVVNGLSAVVGQSIAAGDEVAKVSPGTFSITAAIKPEEQYRLIQQPESAKVTVVGGPAEFTCTGLVIGTATAATSGEDGADAATGPSVRCAVPGDVRVFAGLTGKLALPGASAKDALTLPVTAVKGSSQTGTVWLLDEEGTTVKTDVKLGVTDGTLMQITEGLAEDATVLEFIPAVDPSNPGLGENCFEQPDGSTYCEDSGMIGG